DYYRLSYDSSLSAYVF
nr:immunoglobulin light chain junction region [Macaca mulatta]